MRELYLSSSAGEKRSSQHLYGTLTMFTAIGIVPRHVESAYIDQIEYHPCHALGRANTAERMAQYFNM